MLDQNKDLNVSSSQKHNLIGYAEPSGNFGGGIGSHLHMNGNNASIVSPIPYSGDPRYNDFNYVCLRFKGRDSFCSRKALCSHSNHVARRLFKQEYLDGQASKQTQLLVEMPEATKPDILIMLLDYIDRGKEMPNKIDMYIAQGVVQIAESLKMKAIERKFLMEIIMPGLNRENVIFFVKMAFEKLQADKAKLDEGEQQDDDDDDVEEGGGGHKNEQLLSQESNQEIEEYWMEFFSYTLDLAAANIQYLLQRRQAEFHESLSQHIKEEILERAVRFYRTDMSFDNTLLFDALMKVRECSSIFQLLEQERMKIIIGEEQILRAAGGEPVRPTLTWKNQNLSGNFYRESDPFMVENAQWRLSISYFRAEEEALSVSIKMINNPFEVKKSKDYFKKKEFFLPSNIGMQNMVNPMEELGGGEDESQDEEAVQRRKQIEAANAEYPSHCFITIVSSVRIDQSQQMSESQVHTLICSAKSPALLKKVPNFRIEDYGGQVVVEIYFKIKYIFSAILLYISRNFAQLITDRYIFLLPKDQFKLLLKHKVLHVTQEDEVVKALCLWTENQLRTDTLENDLRELLENVNWNYVTLPCFLDIARNFPLIRRHPSFQKIVVKEFTMRSKFNAETSSLDPPRFSYKYNKTQQLMNLVSSVKNVKNAKCLLYVNHDNFLPNMIDALLEPSDVIQAHIVNDGMNESSHRKYLEAQLQRKRRELQDIEQQLQNMNILDDINNQRSYQESAINNNNQHQHQQHPYNNPSMASSAFPVNSNQQQQQQQRVLAMSDDGMQTIQNSNQQNFNVASDGRQQVQQFAKNEEQKQQQQQQKNNIYEYQEQQQQRNVQVLLESVSYDYDNKPVREHQKGGHLPTQEMMLSSQAMNSQQQQQQQYGSNSETLRIEHLQSTRPQLVEQVTQTDLTDAMIEQLLVVNVPTTMMNCSIQTGEELIKEVYTPRRPPVERRDACVCTDLVLEQQNLPKHNNNQQYEQQQQHEQQHFQLGEQQSQIESEASNTMMMGHDRETSLLMGGHTDFMAIQQIQSIQLNIGEGGDGGAATTHQEPPIDEMDSQCRSESNHNTNNNESSNAGNNSMTLKESRAYKNQQSSADYQKQMKQFTQKVENLSKDIFDHSFLEQFISPQQQKAGMLQFEGQQHQFTNNNQQQTTTRGGPGGDVSTQPFTPSHMNISMGGPLGGGAALHFGPTSAHMMATPNTNNVNGTPQSSSMLNTSSLVHSFYSAQQQQNPLRMFKTNSTQQQQLQQNYNVSTGNGEADTSPNLATNIINSIGQACLYDIPLVTPIASKNMSTGILNTQSNSKHQQSQLAYQQQQHSSFNNHQKQVQIAMKTDPSSQKKDTKIVSQKRIANNQMKLMQQHKMSLSPRTANINRQIANNSQLVRANNSSKLGQNSFGGPDTQHLSSQQYHSQQSASKMKQGSANLHHTSKQGYLHGSGNISSGNNNNSGYVGGAGSVASHHNMANSNEVSLRKNKSSGVTSMVSGGGGAATNGGGIGGTKLQFNQSQVIQGGSLTGGQLSTQLAMKSRPQVVVGQRQYAANDTNGAHMSANSQPGRQYAMVEGGMGSSSNIGGQVGSSNFEQYPAQLAQLDLHSFNILEQLKQCSYAHVELKLLNTHGELNSNLNSDNLNSNRNEELKQSQEKQQQQQQYQQKAPPLLNSVHSSIDHAPSGGLTINKQSQYLNTENPNNNNNTLFEQPELKSVTPSTNNNNQFMLREERGDDEMMQQQQSNSYASYSNKTISHQHE